MEASVSWTRIKASEIENSRQFAEYVQQEMGTPMPRAKDWATINKMAREFFDQYPNASWMTLCKLVDWAKNRKKRFAHVHGLLASYRYAWADGCLPELDPVYADPELEASIEAALEVEVDAQWRNRLLRAVGNDARREVFAVWKSRRSQASPA